VDGVTVPRDQGTGRRREGADPVQREVDLGGQSSSDLGGRIHVRVVVVSSRKVCVKLSRHDAHASVVEGGIVEVHPDLEDSRVVGSGVFQAILPFLFAT
jgi:hypothetical protein